MLAALQLVVTALCFSAASAASGKRGLAYNNGSLTLPFKGSSQVSWMYDWYQAYNPPVNTDLEYVPMLWSNAADLEASWASNVAKMQAAGSKHLLAFNEPDLCAFNAGSSCMTLNDTLAAYEKYIQPYAGKMVLGSPAVTNAGSPGGLTYLGEFLGNCSQRGLEVDVVVLHWYSNKYAGLPYLQSHINEARKLGKPIWLTEFGLTDDYSKDDLVAFLTSAMAWLDAPEQSDIQRYAYFFDAVGPNWLIGDDYQLNDIGRLYAGLPASSTASSSSVSSTTTKTSTTTLSSSSAAATKASTAVVSSSAAVTVKTSTSVASSSPATTSKASISTSSRATVATSSSLVKIVATTTASPTAATSSKAVSSSSASSAIPTGLPVSILSAIYVTQDVTSKSKSLWQHGSSILFQSGGNLWKKLGFTANPWPDHTNTLNVYYSRSAKQRVATFTDSSADCNLSTDTCGSTIVSAPVTKPAKSPITLVAVVWGDRVLTSATLWSRLYKAATSGSSFQITNSFFGVTPMPGETKTAVIWYHDSKGQLKTLTAKQNQTVHF